MASTIAAACSTPAGVDPRSWIFTRAILGWGENQARLDDFILGLYIINIWTELVSSIGGLIITKGPTEDKLLGECRKVFISRASFSEYFNFSPNKSETGTWGDLLGLGYHE